MAEIVHLLELSKSIGGATIVEKVNMMIHEGEAYGFLGPNGSGKTTTLRLILGFLPPSKGVIELFGERVYYGDFRSHKRIGVLSENNVVFKDETAIEYLNFFADIYGVNNKSQRINELLENFDLIKHRNTQAFYFSKGMKQKLALARILLANPDLLILDEPTNGLDANGMVQFREIIELEKQKGKTILISSHILSEVEKVVDKIGIILKGKTVFEGSIENVTGAIKPLATLSIELVSTVPGLKESLEKISGVSLVKQENHFLTVKYHPSVDVRLLVSENILKLNGQIVEMHTQKASLEENYIELTKENIEGLDEENKH